MRLRLSLLLALAWLGCGSPAAGTIDAGSIPDSGTTDAGVSLHPDAGGSPDAGSTPDGGSTSGSSGTVVVHYDVGFGHKVSLRGSGGPLNWDTGVDATWGAGNVWTSTLDLSGGGVDLKPLVDDTTWAVGPNWHIDPGQTLDVWPFFFHTQGTVSHWGDWNSTALGNTRGIWVYLPPSYDENPAEKYPVVYMHDAQNLFYDSSSFSGVSWNVEGAMDQGASDGTIHEAIIVAIENTADRINEYTPVADPGYPGSGKGDTYVQAIIHELKPQIDSSLRTLTDRDHTAMVGSSLGGLISSYTGDKYPDTFGLIGALSPSTWWDNTWIISTTAATQGASVKPDRVYLDSGDSGDSNDDVDNTRTLSQTYQSLGIPLDYLVQAGGQHGEAWWRQRIPGGLAYLLGGR
jgi:predicted alpha/beta superfamily hydrolase